MRLISQETVIGFSRNFIITDVSLGKKVLLEVIRIQSRIRIGTRNPDYILFGGCMQFLTTLVLNTFSI